MLAGSLLCMGIVSCGTTVTARRMLPAHFDITGIESIALRPFLAFDEEDHAVATKLTALTGKRFTDDHFFHVAIPTLDDSTRYYDRAAASWQEAWRRLGKEAGVQAMLGGELDMADVATIPGDPARKEAILVLNLHFLDVTTGALRANSRLIERETWTATVPATTTPPSDDELLHQLVVRMVDRIAQQITPRVLTQKIILAADKSSAEGIQLARENQWAAAITAWKQLLIAHPHDHSALYNIGVADEFLGSYDQALRFVIAAKGIINRPLYTQAVQRIEQRISEEEKRRQATAPPIDQGAGSQKDLPPTEEPVEE